MPNFTAIRPVEAALINAGRRTFHDYVNEPKNSTYFRAVLMCCVKTNIYRDTNPNDSPNRPLSSAFTSGESGSVAHIRGNKGEDKSPSSTNKRNYVNQMATTANGFQLCNKVSKIDKI